MQFFKTNAVRCVRRNFHRGYGTDLPQQRKLIYTWCKQLGGGEGMCSGKIPDHPLVSDEAV